MTMFHSFKNLYLRFRDGAGCCDAYGLNWYLTPIILKSLKVFRRDLYKHPSYPVGVKGLKEWEDILDQMILAFDTMRTLSLTGNFATEAERKWIDKGLRAFSVYYQSLWM